MAIRFTVETLPKLTIDSDYDPNQYTLEDWQDSRRDEICHGFSSPEFEDFTDEQLELLKDLGWSRKRDADYQKHKSLLNDTILACEYAVSDYLRQTIIMAKTRHPKNLFLYVKRWSRVTAIKTKIWECSTLPLMRISVAALLFFRPKAPQDAMTFCKIP